MEDEGSKRGHEVEPEAVKRRRSQNVDLPTTTEDTNGLQKERVESSRWILRRQVDYTADSLLGDDSNTMILMEHLGDTPNMVESLTHQLDSWSLISDRQQSISGKKKPKSQKERVRTSKRALMKVLLSHDVKAEGTGT